MTDEEFHERTIRLLFLVDYDFGKEIEHDVVSGNSDWGDYEVYCRIDEALREIYFYAPRL